MDYLLFRDLSCEPVIHIIQTQPRTYLSTNIRLHILYDFFKCRIIFIFISMFNFFLSDIKLFCIWSRTVCQFQTLKQTPDLEWYLFFNIISFFFRLSQSGSELEALEQSPGNEKDVKWQELKSSKLKYLDKVFDSVLHNSGQWFYALD